MRHKLHIKQLTATILTICLTIGSPGALPVTVYGDNEGTNTGDTSSLLEARDIDGEVSVLLAQGDYEEGRAIVLYDTESPASSEALVGSGNLIGSAEQIAEVSAESYVNATGETLEISEEELVGAASDSAVDDRIAVLAVEDRNRTTEEILRELLADPRVLSAEPDYRLGIDSYESENNRDIVIGDASVTSDKINSAASDYEITPDETPASETSVFVRNDAAEDTGIYAESDGNGTDVLPDDFVTLQENNDAAVSPDDSDTSRDNRDDNVDAFFPDSINTSQITDDTSSTDESSADTIEDTSDTAADPANISGPNIEGFTPESTAPETTVGASRDLTPYQWGMSDGTNRYTDVVLAGRDVYSVNSPKWNTVNATNSEGVIAVIDTGIDHTHPDLKDSMYVIPDSLQKKLGCGKYGLSVQNGVRKATDTMDIDGHGTHCAGIIAASWNKEGVSGVASGAKLMAVRTMDDKGFASYSHILKAYEFVKKAKLSGIDIRATNNSFSITTPNYAMRTMIEEMGKLGIICAFASGNDSTYVNASDKLLNHIWDLPNVVVVNASTENGEPASFSNYSQNETHIYAPGVNILSTVPLAESDEAPRDYFTELDNAPLYTDPAWKNFSRNMITEVQFDWVKGSYWDYFKITKMTDMSSCGSTPALCFTLLKDIPQGMEMTFCFLIPVDRTAPVSYVSADLFTPDSSIDTTIRVITVEADNKNSYKSSEKSDGWCDWVHRSVTGLNDDGRTVERYNDDYIPVYVDMAKQTNSALKAGDCFYIDNISVGSSAYTNDQTAYGFMSGTSMATPFAAGMAMVLYNGKPVSRENAYLLTAGLKGLIRKKDSLSLYCTSGGVLDYSVDSNLMLPVINSAALDSTDNTITLDGYFFGAMGEQCSVNLAGTDLEIVSWESGKVIVKCPDQMASGLQKIILTDAGGLTTRGAFSLTVPEDSVITDTAAPLYETTLPDIPADVVGEDESIISVCGLNDTIYLSVGKSYPGGTYAEKLAGYSIKDKKWAVREDIPFNGLNDSSMTAIQGTVLLNGTDENDKPHLTYYSPRAKDWYEIRGAGVDGAAIENFNNRLLSIGGSNLKNASAIRELDFSTNPASYTELADLGYSITSAKTAVYGDTLYLYEGSVYNSTKKEFEPDYYGLACYTITDQNVTRDSAKEVQIKDMLSPDFNDRMSAICASDREVYLIGAYLGDDAPGSIIDPTGYKLADGDTWVLTDQMVNLGKRLSHTMVTIPCATVYKGVLYGFGLNTQDGDPKTYIARATVVDKNPDTPIQDTIKVKIPSAKKGLKYNGKAQVGVPASAKGYYTIKNNKKTAPGTYKAQAALVDTDYCMWEDGTITPKTITWSIATVPVTGVKISKTNLTIYTGSTGKLTATVSPSGAYDKTVTWKSANTKIAKVDRNGKVTGVKAGTVKVTVTTNDGSKKATCTVKVLAKVPVYRLYNVKGNGDHLFTTSAYEKNTLTLRGWKYEGIAWYEPKTSSNAVYRSYNANNGQHMYTLSKAERTAMAGAGWKQEGIAFYSCTESKKVPVYRLYNPNNGQHFFTKAASERNTLVKAGWKNEGIGFYALGA